MKNYLTYCLIAVVASIVSTAAIALITHSFFATFFVCISSCAILMGFARQAALHDYFANKYGDRFVSYDPDTNSCLAVIGDGAWDCPFIELKPAGGNTNDQ